MWILGYEFPFSDKRETEAKIKRKLRRSKLGGYDQPRIDLLRRFKDEIQAEISRWRESKYYTHSHGEYADARDFDKVRIAEDFAEAFPSIPKESISQFVDSAVYLYYLR